MQKLKIADFKPTAEPPFGLAEEDFVPIDKILDAHIVIDGVETFENAKGPGVYIRFFKDGVPTVPQYTTTHSAALCRTLGNDDLIALLGAGEGSLHCRIIKRPSKTDATKTVFDIVDARSANHPRLRARSFISIR